MDFGIHVRTKLSQTGSIAVLQDRLTLKTRPTSVRLVITPTSSLVGSGYFSNCLVLLRLHKIGFIAGLETISDIAEINEWTIQNDISKLTAYTK